MKKSGKFVWKILNSYLIIDYLQNHLISINLSVGTSMEPTLTSPAIIISTKFPWKDISNNLRLNDLIICKNPLNFNQLIIKRIKEIHPTGIYVLGDNSRTSVDSRFYGLIPNSLIMAKVIYHFSI